MARQSFFLPRGMMQFSTRQNFHNKLLIHRKWTQDQCSCLLVVATCKHLHHFPGSPKDKKNLVHFAGRLRKDHKDEPFRQLNPLGATNHLSPLLEVIASPHLSDLPRHLFTDLQVYQTACSHYKNDHIYRVFFTVPP